MLKLVDFMNDVHSKISLSVQIGNCFVHVHKLKGLHICTLPVSVWKLLGNELNFQRSFQTCTFRIFNLYTTLEAYLSFTTHKPHILSETFPCAYKCIHSPIMKFHSVLAVIKFFSSLVYTVQRILNLKISYTMQKC